LREHRALCGPTPSTPGKRLTRSDLFSGRTDQLEDGVKLLDLKLIKGKIGQADDTRREAVVSFVDELEKAWKAVEGRVDGILLVIDEVDRIAEEPGVATFFKVATELMTARGLENVMLLPVGMVGVQELLKAEARLCGTRV
jgi:hypothetical protein